MSPRALQALKCRACEHVSVDMSPVRVVSVRPLGRHHEASQCRKSPWLACASNHTSAQTPRLAVVMWQACSPAVHRRFSESSSCAKNASSMPCRRPAQKVWQLRRDLPRLCSRPSQPASVTTCLATARHQHRTHCRSKPGQHEVIAAGAKTPDHRPRDVDLCTAGAAIRFATRRMGFVVSDWTPVFARVNTFSIASVAWGSDYQKLRWRWLNS